MPPMAIAIFTIKSIFIDRFKKEISLFTEWGSIREELPMANDFAQGVLAGAEVNKSNPFNVVGARVREAMARKIKERQEEDKDLKDLNKALQVLSYQHNYQKELEKIKAEEERKTKFGESLLSGEIQQIPEASGTIASFLGQPTTESQTIQGIQPTEGEISFKGTPFEAIAGTGRYRSGGKNLKDIQQFRNDFLRVQSGDMNWQDLAALYPDKTALITKLKEKVEGGKEINKPPIEQTSFFGLMKRMKPEFANMNTATRAIASRIKTVADLRKLRDKATQLRATGVDVESLMNYYSDQLQELD